MSTLCYCALCVAHTLAREQRRNFGDDITSAIRLAKRKVWLVTAAGTIILLFVEVGFSRENAL